MINFVGNGLGFKSVLRLFSSRKGKNPTILYLAMDKLWGRQFSLTLIWKLVLEKENTWIQNQLYFA